MIEAFDLIRKILLKEGEAALGTVEGENPFVSAVNYLFKPETGERLGSFYLFLSRLARHSKNIEKNPSVSLLVVEKDPGVPLTERKRVSVIGRAEAVKSEGEKKSLQTQYQNQFPFSEMFFSLPDFHFYKITPHSLHWIAGFGEIKHWELSG